MSELSAEKLAELREIAEAATPGPWKQWNPAMGPSHITIGGKVAFESLQSATRFADDEVIQHWCDATHIAAVDPPTVLALLDLIAEQQAELAEFREREAKVSSFDLDCWYCFGVAEKTGRLKEGSFPIMWLCPTCGNKRCPKATYHDNDCTGSNEPGQVGSRYGGIEK